MVDNLSLSDVEELFKRVEIVSKTETIVEGDETTYIDAIIIWGEASK